MMRRDGPFVMLLIGACGLLTFLSTSACNGANGANVPDPVLTIRVALGDEIGRVVRRSTYDLSSQVSSTGDGDVDLITVTEPAALAYDGAGHPVVFPPGRFISLNVDAGGVVGATTSPHLHALSLRDAIVLARDIGALLEHHGWSASSPSSAAYRAIEERASLDTSGFYRADVGQWRAAGDDCTVRLRQITAASARPEDRRYLLSVDLENPQVLRDRAAVIRQRHRLTPGRPG